MTKYRRHTTNSNPVAARKPAETESGRNSTVAAAEEIYKTALSKLNPAELAIVTAKAQQYRNDRAVELLAIAATLTQYAEDLISPSERLQMLLAMKEDSMYAINHNNQLPENGGRWLEILQAEYGRHYPCCVAL